MAAGGVALWAGEAGGCRLTSAFALIRKPGICRAFFSSPSDASTDDAAVRNAAMHLRTEGRRTWMCGVFRPRQDAESKNPGALRAAGCGRVGETFFFGSVSFGVHQRNELGRVSGRKRLTLLFRFALTARSKIKRFHSPCGERVHFFCWPKRNGTKENGQPRRSKPGQSFVPGFFDSPSWLGRKTPHVLCGALRVYDRHRHVSLMQKQVQKAGAKAKAKAERRINSPSARTRSSAASSPAPAPARTANAAPPPMPRDRTCAVGRRGPRGRC